MSKPVFDELVEKALAEVPEPFSRFLEEVPIEVRDRSTSRERRELGLPETALLLGLYRGRPLTERSVEDSGRLPDVIYLFQDDIESASASPDDLVAQVRKTVLHEIGHHFGMNEADLEKLGYG